MDYPQILIDEHELYSGGIRRKLHPSQERYPEIPWLDKNTKTIFQNTIESKLCFNTDETKRKLFVMICESVPAYLPGSFHQMRCNRLKSSQLSDIELQWNETFRFLYCCSFAGDQIEMRDYMAAINEMCNSSSDQVPDAINPEGPQNELRPQCTTAAEFLLEPWILLQIPFQPILMHQWATALLAESLVFQKKISPIFTYGSPGRFKKITENLRTMLMTMKNCASFMLTLYHVFLRKDVNIQVILYPVMEEFSDLLAQVLPILEFVTSKDASSIISAIESFCLKELNRGGQANVVNSDFFKPDEHNAPFYDFWFWAKECESKKKFNTEFEAYMLGPINCEKEICIDALKSLVVDTVIHTGRLTGVDSEVITTSVVNIRDDLWKYLVYIDLLEVIPFEDLKRKEVMRGVINNLLCLYADAKISEIYEILTLKVFQEVKQAHGGIKICNPSTEGKKTKHTIPEIKNLIQQVLTNKQWTWDKILAGAKGSCGPTEGTKVLDVKLPPKKVAEYFQGRIRRLVYRIAEKHLSTLKAGKFEFVPEHQFVQYVLPCFVLLYLGLCKDTSVSAAGKLNYMHFVDGLITSYEQQEYVQVLSPEKKAPLQNQRNARKCDYVSYPDLFNRSVAHFMLDEVASKNVTQMLCKFLHEYTNELCLVLKSGDLPVHHTKWFTQIDMYMNRAVYVLNDLAKRARIYTVHEDRKIMQLCIKFQNAANVLDPHTETVELLLYQSLMKVTGPTEMVYWEVTDYIAKSVDMKLSSAPRAMLESAQKLSCFQLAGLFVFLHLGYHDKGQRKSHDWAQKYQGPGFPMDESSMFIWSVATNDRWKIKQLVGPMLVDNNAGCKGKRTKDGSLVSIGVIRSNPCYERVLQMITPEGRVRMQHPGEITFVPVKHCRWCGLIEVEKFRLCPECNECPNYWDVNYFCSEKCETESLDSQHREEHARYYEIQLGLEI